MPARMREEAKRGSPWTLPIAVPDIAAREQGQNAFKAEIAIYGR